MPKLNRHETTIILIFLAIAAILFAPFFSGQYQNIFNPFTFNWDARVDDAFYRYYNPELLKDDYIINYLYKIFTTPIWRLIYIIGAYFNIDLQVTSKASSIIIWLSFLFILALITRELTKNWFILTGTIIFAISCDIFLGKIMGGFARSFGFPLIALAFLFLLKGRPLGLAVIAVLGAASYPPVAALTGILMAVLLFFSKPLGLEVKYGGNWSMLKKFTILAVTAILCILPVLPQAINSTEYGRRINNTTDAVAYPEVGPGGRPTPANLPPYPNFLVGTVTNILYTLSTRDVDHLIYVGEIDKKSVFAFLRIFCTMLLTSWVFFIFCKNLKNEPSRIIKYRTLAFIGATFLVHGISIIIAPYFYEPERYVGYPIPLLVAIFLPICLYKTLNETHGKFFPKISVNTKFFSIIILFIIFFGSPSPRAGYQVLIPERYQPLYHYVNSLPTDIYIAGWPDNYATSNIPLVAQRKVLLSEEGHYTFHLDYVVRMRKVMDDIIAVYFSPSKKDLIDFRDKYHVTHFLVTKEHFFGDKIPEYFKPFDKKIKQEWDKTKTDGKEPILKTLYSTDAKVFEDDMYYLIDLQKL